MGLFDNLFNPIWRKAAKLPVEKQVSFALVVMSYGVIRWQLKEIITDVINKTGQRGIRGGAGQPIHASRMTEDQLQCLINSFALGLLSSMGKIGEDPSNKLKYFSPTKLAYILFAPFQMDENYRTGVKKSIDPENSSYSKNADEARTQVIAVWIKILKNNDPEFPRILNLSGFLTIWDESVRALIPGMLIGAGRIQNADIITRAKKECASMPDHISGFFFELADRMALPNFRLVDQQIQQPNASPNLFNSVVRDQGRDKIDINSKGGGFIDLLASLFYVFAQDLTTEDQSIFSIWGNLPTSYWGDEHKKAFAIAQLHFFEEAERYGVEGPTEIMNMAKLIPTDQLPSLAKPLSAGVVAIFMKIYGLEKSKLTPTPTQTPSNSLSSKNAPGTKLKPFTAKEPFIVNRLDLKNEVFSLDFAENQRVLVIGVGDQVVLYDMLDFKNLTSILPHGNNNDISFAGLVLNDEFCLSASWDEKVRLWDKKGLNYIWTQEIYCNSKRSIALFPDRRQALCVDSGSTLYHLDLSDGKIINAFTTEGTYPETVAVDPNGLYAVTYGKDVRTRNSPPIIMVRGLKDGTIFQFLDCIASPVRFMSITENLHCLLVGEESITVWGIKEGRVIKKMDPMNKITCGARAPNSDFLVVGCENGTFEVWDWVRANRVFSFKANNTSITSIAISKDETSIYTGGSNGALRGWRTIGSPQYL